jgi:two-component system LytT family sensor kinase
MKRKYIIGLQVLFWVLMLVNTVYRSFTIGLLSNFKKPAFSSYNFIKYFSIEAVYQLLPVFLFYSTSLAIAPQIFVRKNYNKATIYSLLVLLTMCGLRYVAEYYFFIPVFGFDNYNGRPLSFIHFTSNVFLYYFPTYFVYGLIYFFIINWYRNRQQQQTLQKEKATAELALLRSQVNPHFLFNSINDIYSLTCQRSELAPAALLKLSDILRYMLKEDKGDTTLLQNEITYLENVIELQQISAKGQAYINMNIEGYIGGQQISNLLLIAFVENAFKHGILNDPEEPVLINMVVSSSELKFEVKNKKNNYQKDKTGGIGLNNVRRRLTLIYPEKHILTITDRDGYYTVNLILQFI